MAVPFGHHLWPTCPLSSKLWPRQARPCFKKGGEASPFEGIGQHRSTGVAKRNYVEALWRDNVFFPMLM